MRQQHFQRAATSANLCIYCACRLGTEPASSTQFALLAQSALRGRRHLSTGTRWRDSGISSTNALEKGGFGIKSQPLAAQDGASGLSPAEQAEKANRLRQRDDMLARRHQSSGQQIGDIRGQRTEEQRSWLNRNQAEESSPSDPREDRHPPIITANGLRIRKHGARDNVSPSAVHQPQAQNWNTDTTDISISKSRFSTKISSTNKELQHRQGRKGENVLQRSTGPRQSPVAGPNFKSVPQPSSDRTALFSGGFPPPEVQESKTTDQPFSQVKSPPTPFNGNSYQAVPLDSTQVSKDSSFDGNQTANWQHVRRRAGEPSPLEASSFDTKAQPVSSNAFHDETWVDRSFEEHQRKRAASRPTPSSTQPLAHLRSADRPGLTDAQYANKRCARCGEMGHIARKCPQKSTILCHACGQPGHLANRCPNKVFSGGASGSRAYLTDPYSEGPSSASARRASRKPNINATTDAFTASNGSPSISGGQPSDAGQHQGQQGFPGSQQVSDNVTNQRNRWTSETDGSPGEEQNRAGKATRREQWAKDDEELENYSRTPERRMQRRNRRNDRDDDDEGGFARDQARVRKQARQDKKDAEKQASKRERKARKAQQATPITLPEFISVQNLSQMLGVRYEQFVERLEDLGYDDVFPGKVLNTETSGMIAMEYNFEPSFDAESREEEERDLKARPEIEDKELLPIRPPVVTIMGHVDHGKTTILDYLRKSSVAAGEAGGITQHIGAFSVPLASGGKTITFLDTPGHAAFLAMRQRGANVTDIVILVVAADDSVKPQTLEAIKHARTAGVPMIVAINKIDKEEADVQRCKQDLARHGVEIEDYGGETQVVEVSGKTGKGMEDLEETVVTLSEILDHRAETDGDVEGWVLEATTKKAGRVATVLVRRGTLRSGSVIVAGKTWARVRTLRNEGGRLLNEVGPGMPVEVDGWKDQPAAGDEVLQASSERKATSVVEFRLEKADRDRAAHDMEAINEARRLEQEKREREKNISDNSKEVKDDEPASSTSGSVTPTTTSGQMEVPFIIKADVSGSAEAVSAYILGVSSPLIAPKILHSSVGAINESDIELASVAQGHIIAFNLRSDPEMKGSAESKGVKVLENNIIYRVLDDVKTVLEDKLPPIVSQKVLGEAEVAASFEIGLGGRKKMKIAGCKVRNGVISKGSRVRVTRKGDKVYDGTIDSLKNVKKDVQEMRKGSECGIGFEEFEVFEVGDQLQTYEEISERRKL